jgi:hypothetical protein
MRFSRRVVPSQAMPLSDLVRDRPAIAAVTMAMVGIVAVLAWTTGRLVKQRRLSVESTDWPETRGEVVASRFAWSSSPRSGTSYWPVIRYRYDVGGRVLESDRVSFRATYDKSRVEQAIRSYPVGSAVSVHFQPGDPRQAVLEPGSFDGQTRLRVLLPIEVVAFLFTAVCAALLVFTSRPR